MSDVEDYYDKNPQDEWDRLERHKTELYVTMRAFNEYFPPPPATVLDIGGGPGRYAIALAQKGYTVTLVDISKNSLHFAQKRAKEGNISLKYMHASATTVTFSEHFDIVLLMGPLYHLRTEKKRKKAIFNAVNAVKVGGLICASFVTRYAPLRWASKYEPAWAVDHPRQCEEIINTGITESGPKEESFIDYAWFAHPAEVNPLMEAAGLESMDLIACEGIVSFIDETVNELTGAPWEFWVDLNYRLGKDPAIHGAAEHLLYIGKKV